MRKKPPRYDLAVQRHAVEQVIVHHRPIAQVARQLHCSPQSIKNWIDKHQQSTPISSMTFLPIQVESTSTPPSDKIELVTRNGLTLRFPFDTPSEVLCGIIRQLENAPC
jgi:transposase-like protein